MLLEFPGISPVPSLHFPPITVHESIRSFNVQHNGQGELFCDHNARKRYLSAKNVRTTEAPGPGNNQWGSRSRCPPPVKISYRDMQREGLGVSLSTAAAAAAGEQLNIKVITAQHRCLLHPPPGCGSWSTGNHMQGGPLEQKFIYANDYTVILTCISRRMYGVQIFMHNVWVSWLDELSSDLLLSQTYMEKKAKMNSEIIILTVRHSLKKDFLARIDVFFLL